MLPKKTVNPLVVMKTHRRARASSGRVALLLGCGSLKFHQVPRHKSVTLLKGVRLSQPFLNVACGVRKETDGHEPTHSPRQKVRLLYGVCGRYRIADTAYYISNIM